MQVSSFSWVPLYHCANYLPFTSTLTFITIPPYQQPNNDGCYFLSLVCPRGWLSSFRGGCFKVRSNPLDWNSAKSMCEALGSSLAVLNSKAKLREFLQLLPQLLKSAGVSKALWIGLYRDPKNSNGGYGSMGQPLISLPGILENQTIRVHTRIVWNSE